MNDDGGKSSGYFEGQDMMKVLNKAASFTMSDQQGQQQDNQLEPRQYDGQVISVPPYFLISVPCLRVRSAQKFPRVAPAEKMKSGKCGNLWDKNRSASVFAENREYGNMRKPCQKMKQVQTCFIKCCRTLMRDVMSHHDLVT